MPEDPQPPTWNKSVELEEDDFEEALAQLLLEAPLPLRPAQAGGLVRASYPGSTPEKSWQPMLRKGLGGMCQAGQSKEDCISLLDDVMGLSAEEKLVVALGLSFGPLRESIAEASRDTLAPPLFYSVIATGVVTWAVLAANPEPVFTKGAAIVSALMRHWVHHRCA